VARKLATAMTVNAVAGRRAANRAARGERPERQAALRDELDDSVTRPSSSRGVTDSRSATDCTLKTGAAKPTRKAPSRIANRLLATSAGRQDGGGGEDRDTCGDTREEAMTFAPSPSVARVASQPPRPQGSRRHRPRTRDRLGGRAALVDLEVGDNSGEEGLMQMLLTPR